MRWGHTRVIDDFGTLVTDRSGGTSNYKFRIPLGVLPASSISQAALAKELGTSASRLSNMLAGREVSADALVRALLVLGATSRDVGRVMGGEGRKQRRRAA